MLPGYFAGVNRKSDMAEDLRVLHEAVAVAAQQQP